MNKAYHLKLYELWRGYMVGNDARCWHEYWYWIGHYNEFIEAYLKEELVVSAGLVLG